jgi:uncharacterized protein (PEP-CTERM system associated)
MVDRSTGGGRRHRRALLPLLLGLAYAPSSHAEFKVVPSVSVSETWTDNVNLAPEGQAQHEFITALAPGLSISENTQRLQFALDYHIRKYLYSNKEAANLNGSSRDLQARLNARVIEDLLFLDANASRSQQAISAFGPQSSDNTYTRTNRTEVSNWSVSPYLRRRIGSVADLQVRYTRDSVKTSVAGYGSTASDNADVVLASAGDRRVGWNLRYDRQHLSDHYGNSSSSNAQAGLSWRVQPSLTLNGGVGYDKYDYEALGGNTRGRNWNLGFQYAPSPRTSLNLSLGRRYFGNSRSLLAVHRSRHTVWNITYDEAVTTTRQQFLLPATVDTASLLDKLFMASITDPVQRRQAVDAYMASSGLPASLANNINYLSNRYMLQKQFRASVGFTGVRSVLMLSAFDTRRNALSVQQTDSALLGNNLVNLNDNVRQRGLEATLSYRMSTRSNASATIENGHSESLTTGLRQKNRSARLGMHRQFERKLQGTLELRHVQGGYLGSTQTYTENAVSATLSMTF